MAVFQRGDGYVAQPADVKEVGLVIGTELILTDKERAKSTNAWQNSR